MPGYRLCLLVCLLYQAMMVSAQTNRAFIVAISKYKDAYRWEDLNAHNDVALLTAFLAANRYKKEDIRILSNKQATKQAILHELQELYTRTRSGDHIYLHFSCHGQQMMDDNGDEEDGLDEALIPYDALFYYTKGEYEGENHLRDDELGLWIDKLRRKAGGNGQVLILLDACHSGTANRENEYTDCIRGTATVFAPDGYIPAPGKNVGLSLRLRKKNGFAPATVFSACRDEEVNFEYYHKESNRSYGFLTFSFIQIARQYQHKTTVKTFMNYLTGKMKELRQYSNKKKQTPYLECTDLNAPFKIGLEAR